MDTVDEQVAAYNEGDIMYTMGKRQSKNLPPGENKTCPPL